MSEHLPLHRRLRAYRLHNNVYVLALLVVATAGSVALYAQTGDGDGFLGNLALASATSLLASIFVLLSDTYVKYRERSNDIFLEGIEKLGISNLHFNKGQLLSDLMETCQHAFWASGYRLLLTRTLAPRIEELSRSRVACRLLVSPPWEAAFRSVYGEQDRVMSNYFAVLDAVLRGADGAAPTCEVRVTDKPLFSDTYRVDAQLVTGPYMHNRDAVHGRLTANDFFTYELHRHSRLYELVREEYETVWSDAVAELDWGLYAHASAEASRRDLTDRELQELLRSCLRPLPGAEVEAPSSPPRASVAATV